MPLHDALINSPRLQHRVVPQLVPLLAVVEHLDRVDHGEIDALRQRPDLRIGRLHIALGHDLLTLADLGGVQIGGSPADFAKLVEGETAKWEKVIKVGKVSLE